MEADVEADVDDGLSMRNGGGDGPGSALMGKSLGAGGRDANREAAAFVVGVMRSDVVDDAESFANLRRELALLWWLSVPVDAPRPTSPPCRDPGTSRSNRLLLLLFDTRGPRDLLGGFTRICSGVS